MKTTITLAAEDHNDAGALLKAASLSTRGEVASVLLRRFNVVCFQTMVERGRRKRRAAGSQPPYLG